MFAREDEGLGDDVLAIYNGMKFKMNDLVGVIERTKQGVRGSKTEPIKARFKGVVDTARGVGVLCRPLVVSFPYSFHQLFHRCWSRMFRIQHLLR